MPYTFTADSMDILSMKISDDSNARYNLKLKVNTIEKELSTAKLTDAEKNTYRIAKESISWEGFEWVSPSKIVKLIRRNESTSIQLTKDLGTFNVNICLDCAKPPLRVGERGILSIKTVEDYMEYYSQNGRPEDLALDSTLLANTFTDIRHLSDLDRHEMAYLCEFLTSCDDCKRVIYKLLDSSTTEQIQSMIEQLHVKGNKAQHNFIASLEDRFSTWKLRNETETKIPTPEVSCEIKKGFFSALFRSSVSFRSPTRGHLPRFSPRKEREAIPSSKIAASDPSRLTEILPADPNNAFFSSVFASKFPWVEGLQTQQRQLNSDEELSDYELHMVPLKGVNAKLGTKPMKKLLDAALFNKKKTTLIVDESGSGTSLFLQRYVKELLNNYRMKEPLPFFAKLRDIENPEKRLIPQLLKLYGLKEYEEILKKMPTVWFLDGYHEIFWRDKGQFFNICITNNLDQWPKAGV